MTWKPEKWIDIVTSMKKIFFRKFNFPWDTVFIFVDSGCFSSAGTAGFAVSGFEGNATVYTYPVSWSC